MTRTQPAVAIIMRTRNRERLLERAVKDVLAQSFPDWSLTIINDGGSRAAVDEVLAAYQDQLGVRVTVLHNEKSVGMEAASNLGIRSSASDFIAIHDDDDEWHPDFLARTVGYLGENADAGVAVRTEIVYEHLHPDYIEVVDREIFHPGVRAVTLFDTLRYNRFVPISLLYRRSLHSSVGFFDESLAAVGDWEFLLRVLTSGNTVGFVDGEPLAYWNQRRNSTGDFSNSVIALDDEHQRLDVLVRERYLQEYVRENGLGALLYLTKHLDRLADHLHQRKDYAEELLRESLEQNRRLQERLQRLEEAVSDASLVSLIRRRYRRLKDGLRRRDPEQ